MARRLSQRQLTNDEVRDLLARLREDYTPSAGVFNDEDERATRAKAKMQTLAAWERDMLLLFIEWRNMAKVARTLRISRQSAYKYIGEIKRKIQ